MKLHYSPTANEAKGWTTASPLTEAPCGTRAARGNNSPILGTSLASAVTCDKCKAGMA